MFGISSPELILILAIALIVIGPKHLPELARFLGRALGELSRMVNDFKKTVDEDDELREITKSLSEAKAEVYGMLKEGESTLNSVRKEMDEAGSGPAKDDAVDGEMEEEIGGEELKTLMVAEARAELKAGGKAGEGEPEDIQEKASQIDNGDDENG